MIRIVHLINGLDTGGAETMLAKLVGGMDRARFSNQVISLTDRGRLGDAIEATGVPVRTLGMRRGRLGLAALPRLVRLLARGRPALMQTWLYHADLLGLVAARLAGGPPVLWNLRCSDMELWHYSRQTRCVLRALVWLSRFPAAVLVNSAAGLERHRALGYRPRRWELVPNGFELDRFHPDPAAPERLRRDLGLPADTLIVGLIARVDPMKDHRTFLAAAGTVAAARPRVHFVLVGHGVETLHNAVVAGGLGSRAHLLGARDDIDRLLPGCDVLCLSSAFGEGFPNVLGEAMAAGVPCVATDVGDARAILGDTGVVVPRRDPARLAGALLELIDRGAAGRAALGHAARARVATEYALSRIIERYERIYAELCAATSSRNRHRSGQSAVR